jgi:hypothetical protein
MVVRFGYGDKIARTFAQPTTRNPMSASPTPQDSHVSDDPVEKIVPMMPVVLPIAGGVLIFLLAFIAVFMA